MDYRRARLDSGTQALLKYAERVTRNPAKMTKEDIDALRTEGFSDEAILDAACVASYFNYINRISEALGVELEGVSREEEQ